MKPELSKKDQYWISKHRYYELKHFCLQYKEWKRLRASIDALSRSSSVVKLYRKNGLEYKAKTEDYALALANYSDKIELVESCVRQAAPEIYDGLLAGVTTGLSYDVLQTRMTIPCCRQGYYERYRRFFYLLSKSRQ